MNLYLVKQSVNNDYDTFDSAVVVAKSTDQARLIHPSSGLNKIEVFDYKSKTYSNKDWWIAERGADEWCQPCDVEVELIGNDCNNRQAGCVICSSFNAG